MNVDLRRNRHSCFPLSICQNDLIPVLSYHVFCVVKKDYGSSKHSSEDSRECSSWNYDERRLMYISNLKLQMALLTLVQIRLEELRSILRSSWKNAIIEIKLFHPGNESFIL